MGWKGRNAGRDRDPGGMGKEDGEVFKKSGMRGRTVYDAILGGKACISTLTLIGKGILAKMVLVNIKPIANDIQCSVDDACSEGKRL